MQGIAQLNKGNCITVGQILRRTRVHYRQSVSDVERSLRIKSEQIQAIENDCLEQLPGKVYATGFVKSYSEYLKLDSEKMLELFKEQSTKTVQKPSLRFPSGSQDKKRTSLWLNLLSISLLLGLGLILHDVNQKTASLNIPVTPDLPPEIQARLNRDMIQTAEAELSARLNQMEPASGGADTALDSIPEDAKITFQALKHVKVKIYGPDHAMLIERELKKDEIFFIPKNPHGLELVFADPEAVQFHIGELEVHRFKLEDLENGKIIATREFLAPFVKKTVAPHT